VSVPASANIKIEMTSDTFAFGEVKGVPRL